MSGNGRGLWGALLATVWTVIAMTVIILIILSLLA
jgi:hypothetical protein